MARRMRRSSSAVPRSLLRCSALNQFTRLTPLSVMSEPLHAQPREGYDRHCRKEKVSHLAKLREPVADPRRSPENLPWVRDCGSPFTLMHSELWGSYECLAADWQGAPVGVRAAPRNKYARDSSQCFGSLSGTHKKIHETDCEEATSGFVRPTFPCCGPHLWPSRENADVSLFPRNKLEGEGERLLLRLRFIGSSGRSPDSTLGGRKIWVANVGNEFPDGRAPAIPTFGRRRTGKVCRDSA